MGVTEVALFELLPGMSIADQSLLQNLARAKEVLESYTHYSFCFFLQIEDPKFVYLIGQWDSVKQHREAFIQSKANQDLLHLLKDQGKVRWLLHVDIGHELSQLKAPVLSIGRSYVKVGQQQAYDKTFQSVRNLMTDFTKPYGNTYGWRVDKEAEDKDEAVLFMGWETVAAHHAFDETSQSNELCEVGQFLIDSEIKHARKIDLTGRVLES